MMGRAIVLWILCWSGFVGDACWAGRSPEALLDECESSLSWSESFSLRLSIDVRSMQDGVPGGHWAKNYTYRRDKNRVEWLGEVITYDPNGRRGGNSYLHKISRTEIGLINVSYLPGKRPLFAVLYLEPQEEVESLLAGTDTGGPLLGRAYLLNGRTVIGALREAKSLSVVDRPEQIAGTTCRRVSGKTPYGEINAWIAPEKAHSLLKWSVHRNQSSDSGDSEVLRQWRRTYGITDWLGTYEVLETRRVDDSFVPQRAVFKVQTKKDGRIATVTYQYGVDETDLTPDFQSRGAFTIDLPDATPVDVRERPGIAHVWHDGKVVPRK